MSTRLCSIPTMTDGNSVIMAIDAGGTFFKFALVGLDGRIYEETRDSLSVSQEADEKLLKEAYKTITNRLKEKAIGLSLNIEGIYIDTPGPFDFETGTSLMKHKFVNLYGVGQKPILKEYANGKPVFFFHDSTAFILGEVMMNERLEDKKVAGVMLGTGLGFAVRENGKVILNDKGGPGISLYNTPYNGKTAEDFVSRRGIIARYRELSRTEEEIDVKDIARLAGENNVHAAKTFELTGRDLGNILKPVVEKLNTECIVLGGQISKAYPYFGNSLKEALKDCINSSDIFVSGNPDGAHLIGCAKFFNETIKESKSL